MNVNFRHAARRLGINLNKPSLYKMLFDLQSIFDQIDKKKYISFDIFDTLLIRDNVIDPRDTFYLLALQHGHTHENAGRFKKDRIKAEQLARDIKYIKHDTQEVNLAEIYELIRQEHGIEPEAELEYESSHLIARPFVKKIYDYAVANDKIIFAISDTYFPYTSLNSILIKSGYSLNEIYLSGEYQCGKHERKLFAEFVASERIDPADILHIGDNEQSDFVIPSTFGIQSLHIPKVADLLFMNSAVNLQTIAKLHKTDSYFAKSLLAYAAWRLESEPGLSMMRIFSIIYALPLLVLFSQWIIDLAAKKRFKKVLLMARDGYTLSQVLKNFPNRPDFCFLVVSRRSLLLPLIKLRPENWKSFLETVCNEDIYDVIDGLNIENQDQVQAAFSEISPKARSFAELEPAEQNLFVQKSLAIMAEQIDQEYQNAQAYLADILDDHEDVCVVDVGWSLTSHKALEAILGKQIAGFYLGGSPSSYRHDKIWFFLFDGGKQRQHAWLDVFHNAVELLELPFISQENRAICVTATGILESCANPFETVRSLLANELRQEIALAFAHHPTLPALVGPEFDTNKSMLQDLYLTLTFSPNPAEKFLLGSIPHDRYLSSHRYENIGTYWHPQSAGINTRERLIFLTHIALASLRRDGFSTTLAKIVRRLRLHSWNVLKA